MEGASDHSDLDTPSQRCSLLHPHMTETIDLMQELAKSLRESNPWLGESMKYNDTILTAAPIGKTMEQVANELRFHQSTYIVLEPGDVTRYDIGIILVPARNMMLVSYLQRNRCIALSSIKDRFGPFDFVDLTDNDWSKQFLAWWFNRLRATISEQIKQLTSRPIDGNR